MLGQIPAEATLVLDEGRIPELKRSAERARFGPAAESVDWLADLPEDGTLLPGKLAAQLAKEITDACA